MDKTEQELAEKVGFKIESRINSTVCSHVVGLGKEDWNYRHITPDDAIALWNLALSLLQENAKLTEQRDEWEATAVERQQLCDHWAERATEKDARIKELETTSAIMDEALLLAAKLAESLKPLIPRAGSLSPEHKALWQEVVNVIFMAADHADKHNLETWGGTRKAELHLVPKGGSQ